MHPLSGNTLPEFSLVADDYGWTGKFPGGPHLLFKQEVGLEIQTRSVPDRPKMAPPISSSQAALTRAIARELTVILKRVESEMIEYNQSFEPEFHKYVRHPHAWLNHERDDGASWTFVIERTDNPDFGYHAEFKGTEFVELWAGD